MELFQSEQGSQDITFSTACILGAKERKLLKAIAINETARPADAGRNFELIRSQESELRLGFSSRNILLDLGLASSGLLDVPSGANFDGFAER